MAYNSKYTGQEVEELLDKVKELTTEVASLQKELEEARETYLKLHADAVKWVSDDDYLVALVDAENSLLLGVTKEAELYIPKGLPDGIKGLRELLEE